MRFLRPLLLVFIASSLVIAQELPTVKKRPRIGLVLEGGGALGLAHVGVIHWLEDHQVPVDYVAGTSMGGLIGGMYASGMRPQELQDLVLHLNWNDILTDRIPYEYLSFRRKQDRRAYPSTLQFGLKKGLRLPAGFNPGHQVSLLFDRELLPYSTIPSFDQLPIPFRCVAVDLVSRREHVFQDGPVVDALRATMSLPAIFSPVREDDHIYVDGGMLNNLPVDVARQMGAEVVIAVHLKTKSLDPHEPLSSIGVFSESVDVVIAANEMRSMEKADIVITVNTAKFASMDYAKVKDLIQAGLEAAQAQARILDALALDEPEWQEHISHREARRIKDLPVPQFVEVSGIEPRIAESLEKKLSGYVGRPLDTPRLEKDLTYVVGTGRLASLGYRTTERNGMPGLLVTAREKDYAPPIVNPLFVLDGSELKQWRFAVGARITNFGLGAQNDELRTDLTLGSVYRLSTEYFRPFTSKSRWFFSPQGLAQSSPFDVFSRNQEVAEFRLRKISTSFDTGYSFNRDSELRVGYEIGRESLSQVTGTLQFNITNKQLGVSSLRYALDRADDPVIPRRGGTLDYSFKWFDHNLGSSEPFPSSELQMRIYHPVSKPGSVFFSAAGGTNFGFKQNGLPSFSLGGPLQLASYSRNELLTNQYFLFRAGYLHQLAQFPVLFTGRVYGFAEYEVGEAFAVPGASALPNDVAAGVLVDTVFGPILFGGSYGDSGHRKIFFQLGKVF
jgi:NTE family protein